MAMMIKEDFSSPDKFEFVLNYKENLSLKESMARTSDLPTKGIMVDYEALHVVMTRNFTYYTEEGLKSSIPTWTTPYNRPLIMHHNEEDGKIIGRICSAGYSDNNTLSGTGALLLTANVPDKDGIEKIRDGRLKTTSIGAIVHDARCSICNHNIAEHGLCEHSRGEEYDGKTCYWIINNMEAKELSYVIVPSDPYSQHIKVYDFSKEKVLETNESLKKEDILDKTIVNQGEGVNIEEQQIEINEDGEKGKEIKDDNENKDETMQEGDIKTLEELQEENTALKEDNSSLNTKLMELAREKAELEAELVKAKKLVSERAEEILRLQSELSKEIALREELELAAVEDKKSIKENLAKEVFELREKLGKRSIDLSNLEERTEEFLKESLLDLKAEIETDVSEAQEEKGIDLKEMHKVENPGVLDNNEEKNEINVKENKASSNINVEETIVDMMSAMMAPNRRHY